MDQGAKVSVASDIDQRGIECSDTVAAAGHGETDSHLQLPHRDRPLRLRTFVSPMQGGNQTAYREFLSASLAYVERHFHSKMKPSQQNVFSHRILKAIHKKRAVCDPNQSVRPALRAFAEYELAKMGCS